MLSPEVMDRLFEVLTDKRMVLLWPPAAVGLIGLIVARVALSPWLDD